MARAGSWQHPAATPGCWQPLPWGEQPLFLPPSLPLSLCRAGSRPGDGTPEPSEPALRRLSHHLLAGYQKGTRPVRDWRTTTTVAIDLMVYAILSVVSPPLPLHREGNGTRRAAPCQRALPIFQRVSARSDTVLIFTG